MSARTLLAGMLLLAPLAPAASPAPPSTPPGGELDFTALAAELAERCGGASKVEAALEEGFERTQLGIFEVYFPEHALKEHAKLRRGALQGLIDVQRAWLELFADEEAAERGLELLDELTKWNRRQEAGVPVPASAAELSELIKTGAPFGYAPLAAKPARLVLAPDRRDFQRMVAFFGASDPNLRGLYWHDGVRVWTEFWWNDLQVVSLEYPPVAGDGDDPGEGIPMDFREPTGLEQHVGQRGAMALVWYYFGEGLTKTMELGLAQLLVIDAYGENNVRSGGSMRGSATEAFSAFVPGGNPNGGFLPPINADSDWRADKGKDHFVKALRASQKSAGKKPPRKGKYEKLAWFDLRNGDGRHPVRAPFLGELTLGKEQPPAQFSSDYMEFFRAYKTAFIHWLRTEGTGSKKTAPASFRTLGQKIAEGKGEADFEQLLEEVYGMPLTAEDGTPDSLEWKFLTWLSKQR